MMNVSTIPEQQPDTAIRPVDLNGQCIYSLAETIARKVIPSFPGGITLNPRNLLCLPVGPSVNPSIYVVSMAGHELRLAHTPTISEVFHWLLCRQALIRREGKYIGFWPYESDFYLDISVLIRGKTAAFAFARANGQMSIYHPAAKKSLPVDYSVNAATSSPCLLDTALCDAQAKLICA